MKKFMLLSIAATLVIGGSMATTAYAQKIPGKGLQKASYVPANQLDKIVGCSTGGCATAPTFGGLGLPGGPGGGCSTGGCGIGSFMPKIGCGESAPFPCFPLKGLGKIPQIIPSHTTPNCASPMLSNCIGNLGSVVGRAFARSECKPSFGSSAQGCARLSGPGSACISDGGMPGFASLGGCGNGLGGGACGNGGGICGSLGRGLGGACGGGMCGAGLCGGGGLFGAAGNGGFGFPDAGWNAPVKTPITRNPASYTRWHPSQWYGSAGAGYPGAPQVYRPTDTTQLGYNYQNVPYWRRGRAPGMPAPASIHTRSCPTGGFSTFGQAYQHRSHHDYPWYIHPMSDATQPGASAANIAAARRPVRRTTALPQRQTAQPRVMQAGFRKQK